MSRAGGLRPPPRSLCPPPGAAGCESGRERRQSRGTTGGSASSGPWPSTSPDPEGLRLPVPGYLSGLPSSLLQASAGLEAREEGTGVRGLPSPYLPLLRAGRPVELPSCSPARPQRGCSPLLAAGVSCRNKRVGTWLPRLTRAGEKLV